MIPRCLFLFVGLILLVSQTRAGVGGGSPAGAVPIEVPEIQYAVIDLGKINDVMPDDKEVDLITLGMDGRLAFSWWDGSNYMVAKWKDGQFTDGSPKSMATKIQYLDPISTDTYGSSVAITGPSSDLLSANGDVLRYSPVVEDQNNLEWLEDPYYNSDATALWPYGETDAKDLWWGETGTDGWAAQLFLENGNVVGLAGNGYIGIGVLSANTQQVNYIYEEDPQLGKFWGTDDNIGISPQGDLALNYYEYDTATYYILESAKILLIDSQGNKTEVRNVSGPTAAQIGKTTVINHNLEFILQDSDLGKFVYYKGAASQGKLETLFPWQLWDTLVRYGSAPKMISLTNSGKLLLNLENHENKGTEEKPKYEWVPRTFIADTIPPALYKKDLKVAKFPEGWNIPFDQYPARCQILENNLIATTVIPTKKQNADGTWTDIPENQRKKRPGLLIPIEVAPDILRVNSDFDEQKIDTTTHYAKPDNGDDDLKAERGDKQGKIITDDLHKGFWGLNPNTLPADFFAGATVTITKKVVTDPETDKPEKGTIRLYAIKNVGEEGEESYAISLSSTETPSVSSDSPINLVNELYGSSAPIPRGDDMTYWIEGVDPGPITLEFKYVKGSLTFTHEQKFKVVTQQTKEAWQKEVRDQILLESQGAVDMNQFDPGASFTTNIKFIKAVYGYYEQLYTKYPDEFLWAGMAKMAGAPVFAGLSDAQYLQDHVPSDIVGALVQFFTANLAEFQHQLMLANKLIYDDLAWQHRAYVGSGILALKYVDDKDQSAGVRKVDIQSWNRIDEGIEDGAEPSPNVIDGNKTLLQREQRDVVQDVYNTLEGLRATWLSHFFPVSYNDALSMFAVNPIPGGMDFQLFNPDGNIGVFADRWDWIAGDDYEGMYQIWSGVSPSKGYDSDRRTDKVKISLSTRARDYADFPSSVP